MNLMKILGVVHLTVGLFFILMGLWGLIPGQTLGYEPSWHAILKIILGIIVAWIGTRFLRNS
ncbi:MAG: hypothetical protein ABFC91_08600 [Methanobacteriaceae archaeon]